MKKQVTGIICVLVVIMICLTGCSIFDEFEYKNADIPKDETVITRENVVSYIDSLKIKFNSLALIEGEVPAREAQNAQNVQASVMYEMPDIDDYAPTVVGKSNGVNVEIVFPIEDNNSATSKLVIEAAKRFNETHSDSSITLRIMEPTLANDFIKSGAYLPDGYIATNAINEYQLKESGIKVKEISDRLLGNTVGIVVSENTYNQLKAYYGETSYELETVGLNQYYMRVVKGDINYDGIFKACLDGKVKIGYLNPINNPTGLNFVVSMLSYFDSTNPFSMEASTDFSEFQNTAKVYFSLR